MADSIRFSALIERKDPGLPRFVVVPSNTIEAWKLTETTTITGRLDGHEMGRRGFKKWDAECWFFEVPQSLCQKVGVDTGDRVELVIELASEELPEELAELLAKNPRAKRTWENLTQASRRMLREHVASAKGTATRARRATAGLGKAGRD